MRERIAAVVALGTDWLVVRVDQLPPGVETDDEPHPAWSFVSDGWHILSPLQSQLTAADGTRYARAGLGGPGLCGWPRPAVAAAAVSDPGCVFGCSGSGWRAPGVGDASVTSAGGSRGTVRAGTRSRGGGGSR